MASLNEFFDGDVDSVPIGTRLFGDSGRRVVISVAEGPLRPGTRREHLLDSGTLSTLEEFDTYAYHPCICIDRLELPIRRYYDRTIEYPPEFFTKDVRFPQWAQHFVRVDPHLRAALHDPEFPAEDFLAKAKEWSNERIAAVLVWAFRNSASECVAQKLHQAV
jgi:hypothetical protein